MQVRVENKAPKIGREIYIQDFWEYNMNDILYSIGNHSDYDYVCNVYNDIYNVESCCDSLLFGHHYVSQGIYDLRGFEYYASMYLRNKAPDLKHYTMEDVEAKYNLDTSRFGEHSYREKVLSLLPEEYRFVQLYMLRQCCVGSKHIPHPNIELDYEGQEEVSIDDAVYEKVWVLFNSNVFCLSLPCGCSLHFYQLYFFTLRLDVIIDNELYMPIVQDNRQLWGVEYLFSMSYFQDLLNNMDIYFKNISKMCKSSDYRLKVEGFFCNKVISSKYSLENAVKYLKNIGFPLIDIDYRDFSYCIFKDGYEFESYICNIAPLDLAYCFSYAYMGEGFLLPQDFSTKYFANMFTFAKLPKRVAEEGITNKSDVEEIVSSLKKMNVSTKEKIMSALKLLIQQGKSFENSRSILLSWGADVSVVNGITFSMEDVFRDKCTSTIDKLLVVKGEKSRYTIGEVKEILVSRGYPVDLVDSCIVEYLKDQYIV